MKDYQKGRVLTFLNPENDPLGAGYHILQSKIAIGSAGFFGKGFMQGTQSHLAFLPEKTYRLYFCYSGRRLWHVWCTYFYSALYCSDVDVCRNCHAKQELFLKPYGYGAFTCCGRAFTICFLGRNIHDYPNGWYRFGVEFPCAKRRKTPSATGISSSRSF